MTDNNSNIDLASLVELQEIEPRRHRRFIVADAAGKRYVRHVISGGGAEVYKQLVGKRHANIVNVYAVEDAPHNGQDGQSGQSGQSGRNDGAFSVIEQEFPAFTVKDALIAGVTEGDFEDFVLQLLDALEFLLELPAPVYHNRIEPQNMLVGNENALKLTNFEYASHAGTLDMLFEEIGDFLRDVPSGYTKRYKKIIDRCYGRYETLDEIKKDVSNLSMNVLVRHAALFSTALMVMFMWRRLGRVFDMALKPVWEFFKTLFGF